MGQTNQHEASWALILGGSGAFGLATAKILATRGFNLILVFRERKASLAALEPAFEKLRKGSSLLTFNLNVNDSDNQQSILNELKERLGTGKISFMLHAVADGNLRPLLQNEATSSSSLKIEDFQHTVQAMGSSLYVWSKLLIEHQLFASRASIVGLTSEGVNRVFPDYAAVASAKALMEASMKYMAVEFAPIGLRTNLINAGITDTNALKTFPTYESFIRKATERNPQGRLTTAEDVAKVIAFLASDEALWINGTVITVDGGEQLISFI
jgi:NAD(P)-dependent dehydrogenase (short-subunit alcohol dehydrogenase family)